MQKFNIKKFDNSLSLMILILTGSIILDYFISIPFGLAYTNFLASCIPAFYILKSFPLKFRKSTTLISATVLVYVKVFNYLLSLTNIDITNSILEAATLISIGLNIFIIYGLISSNYFEEIELKHFHTAVMLMGLIYCAYNLIANISQFSHFSRIDTRYLLSFSSFFPNRNNFGQFLLFVWISTFYLKWSIKRKGIIRIVRLIIAFNLFLTLSRTAILAFVIFNTVYILLNKKNVLKKVSIVTFIIIIIFIIILYNPYNMIFIIENFLYRSDEGLSGRGEIWRFGLEMFLENPLFGKGIYYLRDLIYLKYQHSSWHSFYIKTLAEGGIISTIMVAFLFINQWRIELSMYIRKTKYSSIYISTFFCILAYGISEEIDLFTFGLFGMLTTIYVFLLPIIDINKKKILE